MHWKTMNCRSRSVTVQGPNRLKTSRKRSTRETDGAKGLELESPSDLVALETRRLGAQRAENLNAVKGRGVYLTVCDQRGDEFIAAAYLVAPSCGPAAV